MVRGRRGRTPDRLRPGRPAAPRPAGADRAALGDRRHPGDHHRHRIDPPARSTGAGPDPGGTDHDRARRAGLPGAGRAGPGRRDSGRLRDQADGRAARPDADPRTAPAVVDYLRATRDRQAATERRIEVEARWRDALDRLGEWAWPAAIEPLLDHLRGWRLGREPRIGLVPMGVLGAVPWHAASRTRRGRTRYAVQDLQLSYVPSARLLCEVAAAPATIGEDALIVGNPDESLRGRPRRRGRSGTRSTPVAATSPATRPRTGYAAGSPDGPDPVTGAYCTWDATVSRHRHSPGCPS